MVSTFFLSSDTGDWPSWAVATSHLYFLYYHQVLSVHLLSVYQSKVRNCKSRALEAVVWEVQTQVSLSQCSEELRTSLSRELSLRWRKSRGCMAEALWLTGSTGEDLPSNKAYGTRLRLSVLSAEHSCSKWLHLAHDCSLHSQEASGVRQKSFSLGGHPTPSWQAPAAVSVGIAFVPSCNPRSLL